MSAADIVPFSKNISKQGDDQDGALGVFVPVVANTNDKRGDIYSFKFLLKLIP